MLPLLFAVEFVDLLRDGRECRWEHPYVCGPLREWTPFQGNVTEATAQVGPGKEGIVTSITAHLNAANQIVALELVFEGYGAGEMLGDDTDAVVTTTESIEDNEIFSGVDLSWSDSDGLQGFRLLKVESIAKTWSNIESTLGNWIGVSGAG